MKKRYFLVGFAFAATLRDTIKKLDLPITNYDILTIEDENFPNAEKLIKQIINQMILSWRRNIKFHQQILFPDVRLLSMYEFTTIEDKEAFYKKSKINLPPLVAES
jgi:hypothetical protein